MKSEEFLPVAGIILLIVVAVAVAGTSGEATGYFVNEGERVGNLELELAESKQEKREGLMNRENLPENRGMLFIYEDENQRVFWMKNTLIPLDIVFIASNYTVMDIEKAYPEPGTADSELERYIGGPAQYVLEVKQNFTDRKGIEVGDKFYFK